MQLIGVLRSEGLEAMALHGAKSWNRRSSSHSVKFAFEDSASHPCLFEASRKGESMSQIDLTRIRKAVAKLLVLVFIAQA